ncbi:MULTISPECIES: cation-transporting P-type ATPase [unclassified Haladaptatus]|uniref:cation-translocating P-type ATPase n=1 Tax=unclassified Haladaptatus TaxID=2622732 RepID=UPI00209C0E99|nr:MULTISPECIES: cation-transporting P-type ATPase [unclassified Haladaptatus]MCO8245755.1 cation-transporting P-type ATPase [Haladaptatus sp. AB643]MCO8256101.1 cation-transporting P-type ATPase [Haladaptatus sp. AB618]
MNAVELSEEGPTEWYSEPRDRVFERLDSDEGGLTDDDAADRRAEFGPNELEQEAGISPYRLFLSQFQDFLIYLLIFAALLSVAVGVLPGTTPKYEEAALILLILLANGLFGFVQDYRAEMSIKSLQELSTPNATVLRNGETVTVDAADVVPGDIVVIEQGSVIPADARLVESTAMETNEAALTGESTSATKESGTVDADAPLAERNNMVYMNTTAIKGRGRAVVVATGMDTEVGDIATEIQEAEPRETPFQKEVDELGKRIGFGIVALILVIAATQFVFTAAGWLSILLTGITLAVAAVPEGLPAVVTLTLALGSRKILNRDALVRRLPVVESLGSVEVIVSDKTGTLTENQMTVKRVYFDGTAYDVTGTGLSTDGEFRRDGERADAEELTPLLSCGAYCNDAERTPNSADEEYYGDPTEVALLVSAAKSNVSPGHERLREIPFSSERKRMTVVARESLSVLSHGDPVDVDSTPTAYMKGAPEVVLERCDRFLEDGEVRELTDPKREGILERNRRFASNALRVLGFAARSVDDTEADPEDIERDMVFLGLQGMIDPPRDEVPEAIEDCQHAGIRVVMATGDNLDTAKAIGRDIGFDSETAMVGADVEALSDDELRDVVERVDVFARVSPQHKVRILQALQGNGHTVAMTGDGVNDAPALRNADVGISMGIRGTDVAQQASDMVLLDDNFVTIRDAVAEGRAIFDNIRKFVNLLLSANAGEVLTVFFGVFVGTLLFPDLFAAEADPLILTPVMLLWINIVTDGLPALALGTDPKAPNILDRPPRNDGQGVIDRRMVFSIVSIGLTMTVIGLGVFFYGLAAVRELVTAQTLLFTFIVTVEMVVIQVIRSRYNQSPFSNPWLIAAVAVSFGLQLLVLYTPLNALFDVFPVSAAHWVWIALGTVAFVIVTTVAERTLG